MQNQQSFLYKHFFMPLKLSTMSPPEEEVGKGVTNEKEKREAKLKIDNFYCLLIKKAIKEQIEITRCWEIEAGSESGKLDRLIANIYSVQFKRCEISADGCDLIIEFELIGDVREILEKFSMYPVVKVLLANKGDEPKHTLSKNDVNDLKVIDNDIWNSLETYSKEEFEDVYTQISRPYLRLLLN